MIVPYEYRKIPLELVDVPKRRIRGARPKQVEVLAKDIAANGQLQPILVVELDDGCFGLDDGALRVLAMRANKSDEIDARVTPVKWLKPAERTLRGLMANLDRDDFTALERCEALYTLKNAYEELYPQTKNGANGGRGGKKNETEIFSFSNSAAEALGLSDRTIRLAVEIFTKLSLASKERLRGTWIEQKQSDLKALSEVSPELQQSALDLLLREPAEASSVAEAIALAKGERPEENTEKRFNAVIRNFTDLPKQKKESFFDAFERQIREHAAQRGWFA